MDISAFDIWLITRLDSLGCFSFIISVVSVVAVFICFMVWYVGHDSYSERDRDAARNALKHIWKCIAAFIVLSLLSISIPSTKTATAMYFIPKVMKSEIVQNIPDYAKQLMDKVLGIDVNGLMKEAVKGTKEIIKEGKEVLKEG